MPKKSPSLKILSIAEMGAICGKNPRTIYQWIDKGMPVHEKGSGQGSAHKLNAPDCISWMVNREKEGLGESEADYEKARAEKMTAEARLAEIQLEQTRGNLVPIEHAISIVSDRFVAIRGMLLSLPSKAAVPLAAASDMETAREVLEGEVRQLMTDLSSVFRDDDDEEGQGESA